MATILKGMLESGNKIWITGDWHLFHHNIIEYENRPVDFNRQILENFQKLICKDDIVINLGDVIFGRHSIIEVIIEMLPGKHILVLGNHDRQKPNWYRSKGFHWVGRTYEYKDILFSHKPRDLKEWPNLSFNIHGHFHSKDRSDITRTQQFYPFYTEKHLLLSLEEVDYKPVLLSDFLKQRANIVR